MNTLVFGVYAVIVAVMTFPTYPSRLMTYVPGDSGDALLNLWTLHWAGRHLGGWGELWNTSIFWPNENTLAYSESMLPVALVHRVLAFAVRSDIFAFNLLYLGGWLASAWFTYLLARRLTGSTAGAFVAGLVYTFATPRFAHYQHFQLVFAWLVPVVVLLVIRYFERPTLGRAALVGLFTGLLALSASYYGLMMFVALAVIGAGLLLWGNPLTLRQALAGFAVAAGCMLLIVVPVAYQYVVLQRDDHFARDPERQLAAHFADFARVTPDHYVLAEYGPLADRSSPNAGTIENRLFPGIVAFALGGVGAVVLIRKRRDVLAPDALALRVFVLVGGAGVLLLLLSFGTRLTIASRSIPMPYALMQHVPGFAGIRATSRFVAFAVLALALLSAVGLGWLLRGRSRAVTVVVVVACTAVLLAESAASIVFTRVPNGDAARAVNDELDDRPAGPVLELPVGSPGDGIAWAYIETPRQWLSTIDGHPRVGGYSGYDPPGFEPLAATLESFPGIEAFAALDDLGVRYVVLRTALPGELRDFQEDFVAADGVGFYAPETAEAIVDALRGDPRIRSIDRVGDAWLLELNPPA